MTSHDDDDDLVSVLLPTFIEEANEQLGSFEALLLDNESHPGDPDFLDALFRCAHTVKGSAGVFGLAHVVAFAHQVEGVLDRLREGQLPLDDGLSTLLLQCNDMLRKLVAAVPTEGAPEDVRRRTQLLSELVTLSGRDLAATSHTDQTDGHRHEPATTSAGYQIAARFGPDTFRHGMDPLAIMSYLASLGQLETITCAQDAIGTLENLDPESCHFALSFTLMTQAEQPRIDAAFDFVRDDMSLEIQSLLDQPSCSAAPPPPPTPAAQTSAAAREQAKPAMDDGGYIRVMAHRLDEVINLLGELVIAGAGATMLAQRSRQREQIEANRQVSRLIESIRNSTLQLRMVPIGETFSRFRRVVRDTAAELGKDVGLQIEGGDTELDKAMVERIADPLMHLVRNALDHGLETPQERIDRGKPGKGAITLAAFHESGGIVIQIKDDGRGIQRDKVLKRAWERGLLEPGVTPPDNDILKLIFEPGFSTAELVTNLSGRGVGMDVVRSNIEALRGSVTIRSTEGEGSTIEIRLPLTLAIIDGFLVGAGQSRFIFPLDAVLEVFSCQVSGLSFDDLGRTCVDLRGQLLPVIDLRRLYALDGPSRHKASVVVVNAGMRRYGVLVDNLLGQYQTVIKPLGRLLRSMRGISGTSILGSGDVALIIDVDALGQIAEAASRQRPSTNMLGTDRLAGIRSTSISGDQP